MERFEKVTKKPIHPWIKKGLFFCHKDLNLILDAYEKGENFFYIQEEDKHQMHYI